MSTPNRSCIVSVLTSQWEHALQEALFSGASLETQVTTRWQQVSLISPSHNLYTRGTTTWNGLANHSIYAGKVPEFA